MQDKIYSQVTDKIVTMLEAGTRPWARPWQTTGGNIVPGPASGMIRPLRVTGQPYTGINVLNLWSAAMLRGFQNPSWMTFNSAKEMGASVKKGAKSELAFYVGQHTVTEEKNGEESDRTINFLRCYFVFNAEEIDNLPPRFDLKPAGAPVVANVKGFPRMPAVDSFIAGTGATIFHGGDKAFYMPSNDTVRMPLYAQFKEPAGYYATALHELAHWTGHESRLDRAVGKFKKWGDETYAGEELVAELASAFLCADLGISNDPRPDHASYLASWLRVLKEDNRAIFRAATMAEAAAKHLHGLQPPAEPAPGNDPAPGGKRKARKATPAPAPVAAPVAALRVAPAARIVAEPEAAPIAAPVAEPAPMPASVPAEPAGAVRRVVTGLGRFFGWRKPAEPAPVAEPIAAPIVADDFHLIVKVVGHPIEREDYPTRERAERAFRVLCDDRAVLRVGFWNGPEMLEYFDRARAAEPVRVVAEPEPAPIVAEPEPEPPAPAPTRPRRARKARPAAPVAEPIAAPIVAEPEPEPIVAEPEPAPVAEPRKRRSRARQWRPVIMPGWAEPVAEPAPIVAEPVAEPAPIVAEPEPEPEPPAHAPTRPRRARKSRPAEPAPAPAPVVAAGRPQGKGRRPRGRLVPPDQRLGFVHGRPHRRMRARDGRRWPNVGRQAGRLDHGNRAGRMGRMPDIPPCRAHAPGSAHARRALLAGRRAARWPSLWRARTAGNRARPVWQHPRRGDKRALCRVGGRVGGRAGAR